MLIHQDGASEASYSPAIHRSTFLFRVLGMVCGIKKLPYMGVGMNTDTGVGDNTYGF